MRLFLLSLALFLALIASQVNAQPMPGDSTDIIWQVPTGGNIYEISFSPDSKNIAIACNQVMNIYDVNNGAIFKQILEPSTFWSCKYSPDGKYIASTLRSGWIKVWKTEDWSEVFSHETKQEFMLSLDFSKDSKYLSVACENEGIIIFETTKWTIFRQRKTFPYVYDPKFGGSPLAYQVSFSNDNNQLLFSGDWSFLYDISKDTILKTYDGKTPRYSPDNLHFANKSNNDKIQGLNYYDLSTSEKKWSLDMGQNNFEFCFSSDGKYIVTASDGNLGTKIWDINNHSKPYYSYGPWSTVKNVALSLDDKYIAVGIGGLLVLYHSKYTVGVTEKNTKIITTLYPNPTNSIVKIDFNILKSEIVTITISDIVGKVINSINLGPLETGNNSYSYNSSALITGVYYITLQSSSFSQTFKLVKE